MGIEEKWVERWYRAKIFEADADKGRKKIFVTFPYPYMNGPLHLGHAFTATRVDVYARFKRMQGYNVLFPWAWHWTGQPIVAAAERLMRGDPEMVRQFREIDKVSEEELKRFTDPVYMAKYYTDRNRETVKLIGFSVDWRREFHTTSHHPHFSKFIEWQYLRLRERGFVRRGTHPVVWCPRCRSPTGDHDRLKGEGVAPEEFYLVMFKLEGEEKYLVAATFRPETIFGTTNVWLNPEATYVEAEVEGKVWIISKEAVEKLEEQLRKVRVLREFKGEELIGRRCEVPIVGFVVPILPATFVDPEGATGVVYSVPGHAPYDWLALKDIVDGKVDVSTYGIEREEVEKLKPISIIRVPGYGEFPAIEAAERFGAKDQNDPRAEDATKDVYKKEFHKGVMKENCGRFAGMPVSKAKEEVHKELVRLGLGSTMYDLPEPVVCRCTTRCIVKVLEDQWFLNYSDPKWKEMAKKCVNRMRIMPEVAREWFIATIDWLKEWPCARKTGLGTPLPWNREWMVETLSDSTVYMAYYTIAHIVKEYEIKPGQLRPEVFDFVYYGKGDPERLERATGIPKEALLKMREEFLYWYPVDLRNSAKELVPNHLTFFIFHHVALFPEEHWPRAIGVNGMVMLEGKKMSKSTGNIMTISDAISRFGSDTVRATLLLSAEGMDDPDWRTKNALDLKAKISSLKPMIEDVLERAEEREETYIDRWLLSRMHRRVKEITDALESLYTRTAIHKAFFDALNDLKWYLRRVKAPHRPTIREFIDIWIRLLSPFMPFTAEEINESIGAYEFISTAEWPKPDPRKMDDEAELMEYSVVKFIEDVKELIRVLKVERPRVKAYFSSGWKNELIKRAAAEVLNRNDRSVFRIAREGWQEIPIAERIKVAETAIKHLRSLGEEVVAKLARVDKFDEKSAIELSKEFIMKELGLEELILGLDSEAGGVEKAKYALPLRPTIIIE